MGRKFQYVPIDRIISKLYRDLGLEEISEADIIEWTGEALNFMETPSLLEEAVAFIEVTNHVANIPNGLHSIIQVARNNYFEKSDINCPANILVDEPKGLTTESTCPMGSVPTVLDCKGSILCGGELAYYRPYFDLKYEYEGWNGSRQYKTNFSPMRLANHTFFGTLVCNEDQQIYSESCRDEYTIAGNSLKTSFKEGQIAVAYYRQVVDEETGYPMVPDDSSFTTAITVYITMKYMARLWYLGREGYGDKMQKAEADWQWYCKQASNKAFITQGIDEHQNMQDNKYQMVPNMNKYYGYFGKLGTAQGLGSLRGN